MFEFLFLFFAGLLIATYDAVVGSGGLVMISAFSLAGIPLVPAIGTMRFVSLLQEGVSAAAFWKKLQLDPKVVAYYGAIAAIGGLVGSMLTIQIHEQILAICIGSLLLVLLVIIPSLDFTDDSELVSPWGSIVHTIKKIFSIEHKQKQLTIFHSKTILLSSICFGLSIYGGFYGAGFGTLSLFPFFVVGELGILRSAAYARVIGFSMSITASFVFLLQGNILWNIAIPLGIGTVIGSFLGVHFATKMNLAWLKYLLMAVTFIASIDLLVSGSGIL